MTARELLPDLFLFRDVCNVYVWRDGDEAIAIDFGTGRWRPALRRLGVRRLTHVFLTHHHADQCLGLLDRRPRSTQVHAPIGEDQFLSPRGVRAYWQTRRRGRMLPIMSRRGPHGISTHWTSWRKPESVPPSYSVLERGLPEVRYDMSEYTDCFWGNRRLRFIATPGHGPHALSIIINHAGKQIVFGGDAVHAGATIWQPYHLEWDHFTGAGALSAWEGIQRLADLSIDLLCPAHGPVITRQSRPMLRRLGRRLMAFYRVKSHICPGERDRLVTLKFLPCGAREVLPRLYQFGENGYLLLSANRQALLVDPFLGDMPALAALLRALGRPRVTAAVSTHYHADHCDALPQVRRQYGAKVWLHPRVAWPLRHADNGLYIWWPTGKVEADDLWPERGSWTWNEYRFRVAPFGGQTWWHCVFMTTVAGQRVLFAGDNFQPPSRWGGSGGFCAANGSRFREGFIRSAQLVLDWRPAIIAPAHRTGYYFHAGHFRKIQQWARRAESATRALCPSHNLDRDYYLHPH